MWVQTSTTTITWNKKETNQAEDLLKRSYTALMREQDSWGTKDMLALGAKGLDMCK